MPYTIKGKCVFKKNADGTQGDKVGCTSGDVNAYVSALYANGEHNKVNELKEFLNHIKSRTILENETLDTHGVGAHENIKKNDAGRFTIVKYPNDHSEIDECMFESDPLHLSHHLKRGSLKEENIQGIYKSKSKAKNIAQKLIGNRDNVLKKEQKIHQQEGKKLEREIEDLKKTMHYHLGKASHDPSTAESNHAESSKILDQIHEKEKKLKDLRLN